MNDRKAEQNSKNQQAAEAATILIVEDEAIARKNLEHILKKEGYQTIAVDNGVKATELMQTTTVDLVVTDLKMENMDGMTVLEKTRELLPDTEVIMITGYATVNSAVQALKKGAYHYIAKPYKIDEVRKIVAEALLKRRLLIENRELKASLKSPGEVPFIVGKSDAMIEVKKTIRQIAPSDTNVLIFGESGTGKELAAKAIHHLSGRSENRFMAFNCGSFTEELMANELFGHEQGAFTGAQQKKAGLLETADGGTIFLDEVGDMPLSMQVRLLRAIQEKVFYRVGGTEPISTDVRFIAATHRDLNKDVADGLFRQDLFYRLNVISIPLPSLMQRPSDIPLLAHYFLEQKSQEMKKSVNAIDTEAMKLLTQYAWPGNVRELENVIERAVAFQNGPRITVDNLPDDIRNLSIETYRYSQDGIPTLEAQEKRYIQWVLEKCNGNKTKAAKIMAIDRVSLWRKIKRYNLEKEETP
ncbi:MAG: sigma-54-dependent Fis family transcriptional regulator [Desulfobacterales bacterium]|nr:sigma-54-dependent Fis family transcriptional regulator [Desulfobacterales bacterium]